MTKFSINLQVMKPLLLTVSLIGLGAGASSSFAAPIVGINGYNFDLEQFNGASVNYRSDGSVAFDGKFWDNANGVDGVTLGELAAGQYGSDPGDQVSLNDRVTPDWLQLNYATPITISPTAHELVIFEITSSSSGVDKEGTSFKVSFNGGGLFDASDAGIISHYPSTSVEDTNMLVFDLYDFGFSNNDLFSTLYIENKDSGSGTSDPDFIFAGVAGDLTTATVPEPSAALLLALGLLGLFSRRVLRG
ncbi:MAG: PEP-CTERM sorting domain-containing protein [Marinobacter sp.]